MVVRMSPQGRPVLRGSHLHNKQDCPAAVILSIDRLRQLNEKLDVGFQ